VFKIVRGNGTREQNEYRKIPKTNFTLSGKRIKIDRTSGEETGGKYETVTGGGRRRRRKPVIPPPPGCSVISVLLQQICIISK
jgi:hypothetical protein